VKTYDELKVRLLPTDERHLDSGYVLAGWLCSDGLRDVQISEKSVVGLLSHAPRLGNHQDVRLSSTFAISNSIRRWSSLRWRCANYFLSVAHTTSTCLFWHKPNGVAYACKRQSAKERSDFCIYLDQQTYIEIEPSALLVVCM